MATAPYPVPPPTNRRSVIEKHLTADRWFRRFDAPTGRYITLDVPLYRDHEVVTLSARLSDIAGEARGQLTLDISILEEYSTAWLRALSDLTDLCNQLGGMLRIEGMCPQASGTLSETRRLHNSGVRRRYESRESTVQRSTVPKLINNDPARTRFGMT